jgi:alpha-mannosidase
LYKFVEQDYPEIYAQIKAVVAAGRWETIGGMWVEPDCNVPNGESLVRQILLGKLFFKQEFGADSAILWLPDVFGFPWSLPQLMRLSELKYFVTTKLSWNQFNRFPHDTFTWRGIDGSEVLAHFVTTPEKGDGSWHSTYNGLLTPFDVKGLWDNYKQKHVNDELLMIYGWGDGGGGPTKEMLESANVLRHLPGFPRVKHGKAEPYFARLAERLAKRSLPTWDGELYLELHRGTYTSQAYNKRANRKAEILYHEAEWMATMADVLLNQSSYPAEALKEGWELLLFNQFHDILPGSSIRQVYEDSYVQYQELERIGGVTLAEARSSILGQISCAQESLVVFNSLGWSRSGLIEYAYTNTLAGKTIVQPNGRPAPMQIVQRDGKKKVLFHIDSVPSLGYHAYALTQLNAMIERETIIVQPTYLENHYYRIELNAIGQIATLFDKLNMRDVLAGQGNVFQVFEDKPLLFDAWDIDIFYGDKEQVINQLLDAIVEETGPVRGVLRLRWQFHNSTITQRIKIYADSPRIDFDTEVEWHEQQTLLKVAFPVQIRSTKATYDIQWGNIERPTHWNTSWDWARFECVGHKWADLSEGNYGVALLNDCKYGHDIKDNVLRLTLIKSPIRPDPLADQGLHQFTYSLLPHAGNWRVGRVAQHAYDLNYPLHVDYLAAHERASLPSSYSFAQVDTDHVMIETVKRAEDGDGWIVRMYEYQQSRNNTITITFGRPLARAVECNLLEEEMALVTFDRQHIMCAVKPYEIKTFKVWFDL